MNASRMTGLASPSPADTSGINSGTELIEARRLRQHPVFRDVARRAARDIEKSYRGNVILNRLLNDRARIALAFLMLDMHFEPPGSAGLTAGRLKAEASALGLCSPGRAGAVLAACRLLGLVAPAPDSDRRRRRLVVTDRLITIHKDRWRAVLGILRAVLPEGEIGLRRLDDPAFLPMYVSTLLQPYREGWRVIHDIPELAIFADRDGGLVIALALYQNEQAVKALSAAHLARTYHVSRSHIAGILGEAAEAGLVRRIGTAEAGGPGFLAEPSLVDAVEMLMAIGAARHAQAVRNAMQAMESD